MRSTNHVLRAEIQNIPYSFYEIIVYKGEQHFPPYLELLTVLTYLQM